MHKNTILFCVFLVISFIAVIKCQEDEEKLEPDEPGLNPIPTEPEVKPEPTAAPTADPEVTVPAGGTDSLNLGLEFLKLHNDARKKAGSLAQLSWNDDLAGKALNMAKICNPPKEQFNDDYTIEYKLSKKVNPKDIFQSWLKLGKKVKKGNTSKCCGKKKTSCCRYARVMSTKFKNVGCATYLCPKRSAHRTTYTNCAGVVCVYN